MKVKINDVGYLFLERKERMKLQYCPYQKDDQECGDWCPLFTVELRDFDRVIIKLCKGMYATDLSNFEDDRGGE